MVLQQGLSSTRDGQHPTLHPILYECCLPRYRSTCGTRGLEWLCDVKNDALFSHGDVEGVRRFWQGCPDSRFTSIASVTFSNLGTSRDAAYFDAKGQTSHPKCLCILGGTKLQSSFMQSKTDVSLKNPLLQQRPESRTLASARQNKIQQPQTLFQWQDTLTCRGSCKTHLGINRLQHKLQS